MSQSVSRRNFVTAGSIAMAGMAAVASAAASTASADEAAGATAPDYDVIIVGAGLAGLATGVRLLENGVPSVLIVTKGDGAGAGANSSVAGGQFLIPMEDTDEGVEMFYEAFMLKSEGKGREDLSRLIAQNAQGANAWLQDHGCEFTEAVQVKPYNILAVNAAPGAGVGMPTLIAQMDSEYQALGGQMLSNAKLLDFTVDEKGAVSGVKVRTEDGIQHLTAANTVVATGGYLGNKQLMEQWCGADGDQIIVRGHKTLTGDGLLAAERVGGMQYTMGGIQESLHIAPVPPTMPALCPFASAQYTVVVNTQGQRFVDEALGYVAIGKAAYNQPGQTHALIFDSATLENVGVLKSDVEKFGNFGIPVAQADTIENLAEQIGVDPVTLVATIDGYNAAVSGEATEGKTVRGEELEYVSGDTPEAIAELMGVDPAGLAATIEAYNAAVDAGFDPDFGRQPTVKLEPPFVAMPVTPCSIITYGGIARNAVGEVVRADGTSIPGLFCAGETSCNSAFMGFTISNAITWGRIAGAGAAQFATA